MEEVIELLRLKYHLPKGKLSVNKDHWHNHLVIQQELEGEHND